MIVMIVNNRKEGDGEYHRLLLYLSNLTGTKFVKITPIKNGIWLCNTKTEKWILKQFPTLSKLTTQIKLTEKLLSNQFRHTYRFHAIHSRKKIIFNQKTYGLIEYIGNQEKGFSYRNHEHRNQALQLLKKYHAVTEKFTQDFRNKLPEFDQINKWQTRLMEFKANYKLIRNWLPKEYLNSYLYWAEWSVENMLASKEFFINGPRCIVHGDVAHHNFILSNKELYLIDFDLAKIAIPMVDDLQFSNRILPYLDWSLEKLFQYKPLENYKSMEAFVCALLYPTDILREWNHFIRSANVSEKLTPFLEELSFKQFNQRQKFANTLIDKLTHH